MTRTTTTTMTTTTTYLRPSRGVLLGGLLGGIATAAGMALTATSGWLIVRAAERPVILTLLTAIVAVRTFGIVRPVFRYWERLASHDAALATLAGRRSAAYGALIPLTPARLGRRRRSDVLTGVVDDLTDVVDAQVRVTVPVLSSAFAGALAIALTTWVEPAAGAVLAVLALAVVAICAVALRLESASLTALLEARAEVNRISELVSTQAGELRAVGGWETAMGWLDAAHSTLGRATRRQSLGRATASGMFLVAVAAAVLATAHLVLPLDLGAPVKALLLLTPVAVSDAISPLTDAMQALARARGSAARITTLLDLPPAVHTPSSGPATHDGGTRRGEDGATRRGEDRATRRGEDGATRRGACDDTPRIEGRGLTASWTGERTDLAATDLELPPGARIALTGPNGSGKSTLLAVLARHLDPQAGVLTWDGVDVRDQPLATVRGQIAFVDDETHVFATTLRHNLLLAAPAATDPDLTDALGQAGLAPLLAALPDGLDTRIGADGRGLSGGERARLGIARALASGRPLMLLDEPVAHLDPPTARAVLADLLAPGTDHQDRIVVMATHRPEGLGLFDAVVALDPSTSTSTSTSIE